MRSIHELRLAVAAYYFCEDMPAFFTFLGMEFIIFWDKMNALASRGMTKEEWEAPHLKLDHRKVLTQEEFDALFAEARALRVDTNAETDIETGLENDFE